MITGLVSARHALVRLFVRSAEGREDEVEFVLDTGFVGFLTLPPAVVAALALPLSHTTSAYLADGSRVFLDVHKATVLWDGAERPVEVLSTGGEALLGTSLLDECEVCIQFTSRGLITIEPL